MWFRLLALSALVAAGPACSPAATTKATTKGDRFVEGGSPVAKVVETPDKRVRVPLPAGLTWESTEPPKETLAKIRAPEGPTFVVVAQLAAAAPVTLEGCVESHRTRLSAAAMLGGVKMTPPRVSDELRHGKKVPRLQYGVALEVAAGALPASALTVWTYLLDADRCIGVGVTAVVHARKDDASRPDLEDLQRLDRVFEFVADGTTVGQK